MTGPCLSAICTKTNYRREEERWKCKSRGTLSGTALKFSSKSWKWATEDSCMALSSWSRDAYACALNFYNPAWQSPVRSSEKKWPHWWKRCDTCDTHCWIAKDQWCLTSGFGVETMPSPCPTSPPALSPQFSGLCHFQV